MAVRPRLWLLFGYYDRDGYPNMYTGPDNGGVAPLTDLGQGDDPAHPIAGACSIIATQNGFDGRTTRGHVDDYWISYGSRARPLGWALDRAHLGRLHGRLHGYEPWKWDTNGDGQKDMNVDGGTAVYSYASGSRLYDYIPPASYGLPQTEACHGIGLFAQSRGYTVQQNYTQKIDTVASGGFSFADLQAEINAGHPVLTHMFTHNRGPHGDHRGL